jgi:lipopolysaccharide heptosyltransferase II
LNILVIKPSSLGDVVQALPVLKSLHEKYPGARIDWLVNDALADILLDNPRLRAVLRWDRASWRTPTQFFRAVRNAASIVRRLRAARYDLVIDLQGLFRSAVLAALSGGKVTVGFADGREMSPWFYDEKIEAPRDQMHSVDRYVLAAAGETSDPKEFPINFSASDTERAKTVLHRLGYDHEKLLVILVPAARWPTKRWPSNSFASLAHRFVEDYGVQVGIIGSRGDALLAQHIASLADCETIDFSGHTTLKQLAYLLSKAAVVVGNDSGPIHVAAAVGAPVVALYGPTSSLRTGPYGTQHTVLTAGLACSPCFSRTCNSLAECMTAIPVDAVFLACEPYLKKRKTEMEADSRGHHGPDKPAPFRNAVRKDSGEPSSSSRTT